MKRILLIASVAICLMLSAGCQKREKLIKKEIIFGVVVSMRGNYLGQHKKVSLDCKIIVEVENTKFTTFYRVDDWGGHYYECASALLTRPGDVVNVIKYIWADGTITYSLDLMGDG